ncbi:MAG: hypothetical protein ACP5GR_06510 [Thermoplasmata archaeon]
MTNKWHIEDVILEKNQGAILFVNKGKTRARLVWLYGQPIIGRRAKRRN